MRQLRKYGSGVLMIVAGVAFCVVLLLAPVADASAHDGEAGARRDFDRVVREIGAHYQVQPKSLPMMGLVSLCARVATRGGVGEMKVVRLDDESGDADRILQADQAEEGSSGFAKVVRAALGDHWTQMVREHQESGEESLVFVQNDAEDLRHTRMIVMDLDHSELNMVALSLDPEQLERWMNEREGQHGWFSTGRRHPAPSNAETTASLGD
jgi:hypothetical protein